MIVKLNEPWSRDSDETWIEVLRRAVRASANSNIRRMLPLSPENVLALIEDAQGRKAHGGTDTE